MDTDGAQKTKQQVFDFKTMANGKEVFIEAAIRLLKAISLAKLLIEWPLKNITGKLVMNAGEQQLKMQNRNRGDDFLVPRAVGCW